MFVLSKNSTDLAREYWKAEANTFGMARDALIHKVRSDARLAPWPFSGHLHAAADELADEQPAPFVSITCGPWEYAIEFRNVH